MEADELDAVVVCSYEMLCYFAGTDIQTQLHLPERLEFLIATRHAAPTLLVCDIEASQVRSQTPIDDIHQYIEFEDDPASKLADLLTERGAVRGRVGIEGRRLPSAALRTLERALPEIEWTAADLSLQQLQAAKTAEEVELLTTLAHSLHRALKDTIDALGASANEHQYGTELVARVAQTGALPLFLVFAAGERTMHAHPEPLSTPFRPGSIWRTDFGARLPGGWVGDIARTGVVGPPASEQEEIFAIVRAAQDAAVSLSEPGRPANELYEACRRTFERNHLSFAMPHVGHGIGIGLHEYPLLEPRNTASLVEGTVLNIEPLAIVASRSEGYHTEDLVLVTAEGPERLTAPQDALLVIS
jgi:Xaa-Pro aminopeptidase